MFAMFRPAGRNKGRRSAPDAGCDDGVAQPFFGAGTGGGGSFSTGGAT